MGMGNFNQIYKIDLTDVTVDGFGPSFGPRDAPWAPGRQQTQKAYNASGGDQKASLLRHRR